MAGQRRKKGGRVTPKGGAPVGRLTSEERAGLEEIFERILRTAPKDLTDHLPPVAVEMWASQMWSIWARSELVGMDAIEVFAGGLIAYAATRATPAALERASCSRFRRPCALRAERPARGRPLGRRGCSRSHVGGDGGAWEPTVACLSYDPVDDDGVNVMVGFEGPAGPSTVGVYVDHNLGGMAKDAFAAAGRHRRGTGKAPGGPCRRRRRTVVPRDHPRRSGRSPRQALEMTDMYMDSTLERGPRPACAPLSRPGSRRLPHGGEVPVREEVGEDERNRLLSEFLDSDETVGLWGIDGEDDEDEEVERLAHQILTFAFDYVVGTSLRFSPVMVEMFCLDWAPRKVAMDGDAFTLLPDVLAAWIRFVGRRRRLRKPAIGEAVEAAYEHAPEMVELRPRNPRCGDRPRPWPSPCSNEALI